MKANDVIKKAYDEIGISEYPPNSNNVKYNTAYYGRQVSGSAYPWCCTFIWWLLSTSGVKVPKTASCANMGNYYKKEGRFFTQKPSLGDLVFFKYNRTNNWTNHIGIVVEVTDNYIWTIEGNTSINSDDNGGAVMKRKRSSNIVGYAHPEYDDSKPILRRGDKNDYVLAWQNYLLTCGIDIGEYGADGEFGKDTEKAVKEYQKLKHLPITGIIDQDDWDSVGK